MIPGGVRRSRKQEGEPEMQTALCTIAFRDRPVEAVLDLARDAGFDGVEPWGKPPHIREPYDPDQVARLAEAVRTRGMVVSQHGSYANPLSDDFEREIAESLQAAQTLGTDKIRVWAGRSGSAEAPDSEWEVATSGFRRYADRASEQGVTLVLEMHNGYLSDSAEGSLRLIREVDRPNFRLNYQPNYTHEADRVLEESRKVASHVSAVHAQNYQAPGSNKRSLVAEGFVDYGAVVKTLRDAGFDGFLEVEFVREQDPELSLKADAAYLRSLCASA